MKKLILIVAMLAVSQVFAEVEKNEKNEAKEHKPCLEMKKACESAGFIKGKRSDGKSLYKDCIFKLNKGEIVQGVSVSTEVVAACKQKRQEHLEHKAKKINK